MGEGRGRRSTPDLPAAPDATAPAAPAAPAPAARHRPGFRGDVQGLRAIAVLTVIASHAGLSFVPGGFVGVDVFFVISGFLITGLLLGDLRRSGRISLRDFYARRARRILPAATLVTLVVLVASAAWLSIVDALSIATDAVWATFFAANYRFISVGTDYDAFDLGPSPMQHYWSLAVEEQFYLVWPLLLVACVLIARRAGRRRPGAETPDGEPTGVPRRTVLGVLLVLTAASFAFGVVQTATASTTAYFSTPARAWELGVGALAALVAPAIAGRLGGGARGLLALGGLGAIALACVRFDDATPFPGVAALLPVLGAAAVLVAGAGGHDAEPAPIRALGVGPLRVVGDWSYSLYLWHWPLLVIPARVGDGVTGFEKVGLVALTFVLAALTYRFVETPFRNPVRLTRRRSLALYPVSALVVCVAAWGGNVYGQYETGEFGNDPAVTLSDFGVPDEADYDLDTDPTVALVEASVIAARNGMAVPSRLEPRLLDIDDDVAQVEGCDYRETEYKLCPQGDPDGDKTLVVTGDSHARMWIPAFEKIAEQSGYVAYYLVKPNCTASDITLSEFGNNDQRWEDCDTFRDWVREQVADLDPDLTVVASTGATSTYVFTDDGERLGRGDDRQEITTQGFQDTFEALAPLTDRLVLLSDVPSSRREPSVCLTEGDPDLGDCLFTEVPEDGQEARWSVRAAERTGTETFDPTPWVCWEDQCPAVVGDMLTYRDRSHLSTTYTGYLGEPLGRALGIWDD